MLQDCLLVHQRRHNPYDWCNKVTVGTGWLMCRLMGCSMGSTTTRRRPAAKLRRAHSWACEISIPCICRQLRAQSSRLVNSVKPWACWVISLLLTFSCIRCLVVPRPRTVLGTRNFAVVGPCVEQFAFALHLFLWEFLRETNDAFVWTAVSATATEDSLFCKL